MSDQATETTVAPYFVTYTTSVSGKSGVYFANRAKLVAPSITSSVSNLAERALQQASAKLGATDAGVGEALGEFRETLDLLRSPFKSLRDFLHNDNLRNLGVWNRLCQFLKSGLWKEPGGTTFHGAAAAKVAANSWLEFRYGLMPLIYTVEDIIKLVNEKAMALDKTRIHTARAKVKLTTPIVGTSPNFYAQVGFTEFLCEVKGEDKITARGIVHYRLNTLPSLMDRIGLTPSHFPELAWELTTRSFVVDWWLSVGDWLGAFRGSFMTPEVTVLGNTVGVKIDRQLTVNASSRVVSVPGAIETPRGHVCTYNRQYYERKVNQHLPILPQFKPEFKSVLHTIDAAALILTPILGILRK